jgi:hypothetical protein
MIEANTTLFALGDLAFTSSHDGRSLPHRQLCYSYQMIGGEGFTVVEGMPTSVRQPIA